VRTRRPEPLAGRTVVVTGAGSGIGRALARRLSGAGCSIAIADIDVDGLAETAHTLVGAVFTRALDVRDAEAFHEFAAEVKGWAPAPLGAVVNNAGVAVSASVADGDVEDDRWLHDINFHGVVNGTRAFLPMFLAQNAGTIVNLSSVYGLVAVPNHSAYCASKFAVRGFTESLRAELHDTGVRAVAVHPGGIKTNIARNARVRHDPEGRGRTAEQIAQEFDATAMTTPERAAEVIHRGVDAGRARILVGADAALVDVLARVSPSRAPRLIARLESLLGERSAAASVTVPESAATTR
jgi:NADP-dependent 3-hydroxy acid dehydrogenase YdfG